MNNESRSEDEQRNVRVPPTAFLNVHTAMEYSRYYTNDQLMAMFLNLKTIVSKRCVRRQHIALDNISCMLERYLKENLNPNTYKSIHNIYLVEYVPEHFDTDWKNDDPYGVEYPAKIRIYFRHGEDCVAKRYIGDVHDSTLLSNYLLTITKELRGTYYLKITPPAHHVRDPPYNIRNDISESAEVNYVTEIGVENGFIRKSKCSSRDIKNIYGGMLKEIESFYVKGDRMKELFKMCKDINTRYSGNFITSAKSAVFTFLLIGRYYQTSLHETLNIPYDVIKLIAQKVWGTRCDKEVWGVGEVPLRMKYDYAAQEDRSINFYDEDSYSNHDGHANGWAPYYFDRRHVFTNHDFSGSRLYHPYVDS